MVAAVGAPPDIVSCGVGVLSMPVGGGSGPGGGKDIA